MVRNPIIVAVKDSEIPDDQSEECVDALVASVEGILADYGNDPEFSIIFDGQVRSQTNPHVKCPECRNRLNILDIQTDKENGAFAEVKCVCGWEGLALYRLIDLKEKPPGEDKHGFDDISHVSEGNLDVTYIPYENTDMY